MSDLLPEARQKGDPVTAALSDLVDTLLAACGDLGPGIRSVTVSPPGRILIQVDEDRIDDLAAELGATPRCERFDGRTWRAARARVGAVDVTVMGPHSVEAGSEQ